MKHYTLPHQHGQSMSQLVEHIPDSEDFQIIANIFKQLSDPTRIRIFWILCHCEECVINISAMMETYYRASQSSEAQSLHHMIEQMMDISCIHGNEHHQLPTV